MRKATIATFTSFGFVTAGLLMGAGPVCIGRAQGQTVDMQRLKSAALMGAAIAESFGITTSVETFRMTTSSPDALITFESAATHDNVVEVSYVMTDHASFLSMKRTDKNQLRRIRAPLYCTDARIVYLRQGVVVHEVFATSDHSDRINISIDASSCADPKHVPGRSPHRLECPAARPHSSDCAQDDGECQAESETQGCPAGDRPRSRKRRAF